MNHKTANNTSISLTQKGVNRRSLWLVGAFLAFLLTLPGCGFVVYDDPVPGQQQCYPALESCTPVCQTVCDWYECYEECRNECVVVREAYCEVIVEEETTTTETCEGPGCTSQDPKDKAECSNTVKCADGYTCESGKCKKDKKKPVQGTAGLCQTCQTSADCIEDGARCLEINFDSTTLVTEKICGRLCKLNTDCPNGFECVRISADAQSVSQCLPKVVNKKRTCHAAPELECVYASDCALGQTCKANKCTSD